MPIYMRPPALRSLAALLWVAGRRERAVEMMQEAVYRTTHSHGPEQALVDLRKCPNSRLAATEHLMIQPSDHFFRCRFEDGD